VFNVSVLHLSKYYTGLYWLQGKPSGEAFVKMNCQTAAFSVAHHCQHRMFSDKKRFYVEAFQCSEKDLNSVSLNHHVMGSISLNGAVDTSITAPLSPEPSFSTATVVETLTATTDSTNNQTSTQERTPDSTTNHLNNPNTSAMVKTSPQHLQHYFPSLAAISSPFPAALFTYQRFPHQYYPDKNAPHVVAGFAGFPDLTGTLRSQPDLIGGAEGRVSAIPVMAPALGQQMQAQATGIDPVQSLLRQQNEIVKLSQHPNGTSLRQQPYGGLNASHFSTHGANVNQCHPNAPYPIGKRSFDQAFTASRASIGPVTKHCQFSSSPTISANPTTHTIKQ